MPDSSQTSIALPDDLHSRSGRPGPVSMKFDIIDASIKEDIQAKKKFVVS